MRSYAEMTDRSIDLYNYRGDLLKTLSWDKRYVARWLCSASLRAMFRPHGFSYLLTLNRRPFKPIKIRVYSEGIFVDAETGEQYNDRDLIEDLANGDIRYTVSNPTEDAEEEEE